MKTIRWILLLLMAFPVALSTVMGLVMILTSSRPGDSFCGLMFLSCAAVYVFFAVDTVGYKK